MLQTKPEMEELKNFAANNCWEVVQHKNIFDNELKACWPI